ncbi:MAG TPA: hypothetical protein VMP12_00745 [Candidatus Sulfotelmatobacter sp.]|nr:hypothetical protein [Candidatus Sulfotelmatobacter sp.]
MHMTKQDEYEAQKKVLVKELSADFQSARGTDSANVLTKSLIATGSWVDGVKDLLADSVALGRDLDRSNFARDPQVAATIERAEKMMAGEEYAPAAFIAQLLDLSLGDARQSVLSLGKSGGTLSPDVRETAAVIGALIKTVNTRGYAFQGETLQAQHGRRVAREAWKAIEPRAAFWDRPVNGASKNASSSLSKFAGMSPDQIRQNAADNAARIERECAEALSKVAGGRSGERIEYSSLRKFAGGDERIDEYEQLGKDREGLHRVRYNGHMYVEVIR